MHDEKREPKTDDTPPRPVRKPYEPPRVDKRRSLVRVTLLTGMGQMAVGVIGAMN